MYDLICQFNKKTLEGLPVMLIRLKRDQVKSVKTVMLISSFYLYVLLFIFNVAICSIPVHSLNITKKN